MPRKGKIINLSEWYTVEEATNRLSQNSGRTIDKNYPRTLARYGKIRSLDLGGRGKLYYKADVDGYVVSNTPGRKVMEPGQGKQEHVSDGRPLGM